MGFLVNLEELRWYSEGPHTYFSDIMDYSFFEYVSKSTIRSIYLSDVQVFNKNRISFPVKLELSKLSVGIDDGPDEFYESLLESTTGTISELRINFSISEKLNYLSFPCLKKLKLDGDSLRSFNTISKMIETCKLESLYHFNYSVLELGNIPSLRTFSTDRDPTCWSKFISKNPQITTLMINYLRKSDHSLISPHLQNLQVLVIDLNCVTNTYLRRSMREIMGWNLRNLHHLRLNIGKCFAPFNVWNIIPLLRGSNISIIQLDLSSKCHLEELKKISPWPSLREIIFLDESVKFTDHGLVFSKTLDSAFECFFNSRHNEDRWRRRKNEESPY